MALRWAMKGLLREVFVGVAAARGGACPDAGAHARAVVWFHLAWPCEVNASPRRLWWHERDTGWPGQVRCPDEIEYLAPPDIPRPPKSKEEAA